MGGLRAIAGVADGSLPELVWLVLRAFVAEGDHGERPEPRGTQDVLAERFGNGEIDAEDYWSRLHALEGTGGRKAG